MIAFNRFLETIRVKIREELNPIMGKLRRKRLINCNFTIISNNCWAGHVYRYFGLPYSSPTIGLYFYAEDYVKLCENLLYYMSQELKFISVEKSKYKDDLKKFQHHCPIGVLDDIEVIFLHYKSEDEAYEKWNRRKQRIVWDNIFYKMSEQNLCREIDLKRFDRLETDKKFVFVSRDYGLSSQILWGGNVKTVIFLMILYCLGNLWIRLNGLMEIFLLENNNLIIGKFKTLIFMYA